MNKESDTKRLAGIFAGMLAGILLAGAAAAQTPSYEGKQLRMIIPSGAGGGYDTYARVLSAHLEKHLPGKPNIINQNMPGASGMIATNWAASDAAPKDGSVIVATYNALLLEPLFDNCRCEIRSAQVRMDRQHRQAAADLRDLAHEPDQEHPAGEGTRDSGVGDRRHRQLRHHAEDAQRHARHQIQSGDRLYHAGIAASRSSAARRKASAGCPMPR